MRWVILAVLSISSLLHAAILDSEVERQIVDSIQSTEFSNFIVYYPYGGQNYPIQIVHNPQRQMLWGNQEPQPNSWLFIAVADLPFGIAYDLNKWLLELFNEADCRIDLRGFSDSKSVARLHPIWVAERIDDPLTNIRVQEIFQSPVFQNEVLYYHLGNQYYPVRLLYNPEKRSFSAAQWFRIDGVVRPYTISWSDKYGIITHQQVPQELIDHLSRFVQTSCWEWYFNFTVYNGTYVQHIQYGYNYDTYYDLDTWFNYTANLQSK